MPEILRPLVSFFVGLDVHGLGLFHLCVRALLMYFLGIIIIRINERFIGLRTQFNFILYIMLGSILASGVVGAAPFFSVLGMTIILMFINLLVTKITCYSPFLEALFKGRAHILISHGAINWQAMRHCSITTTDLLAALRLKTGTEDLSKIDSAYFENSGDISIILKK